MTRTGGAGGAEEQENPSRRETPPHTPEAVDTDEPSASCPGASSLCFLALIQAGGRVQDASESPGFAPSLISDSAKSLGLLVYLLGVSKAVNFCIF